MTSADEAESGSHDGFPTQLRLSVDESLLLALLQYRMMQRDLSSTTSPKGREAKRTSRDEFRAALYALVSTSEDQSVDEAAAPTGIVAEFVRSLQGLDGAVAYSRMEAAGLELASDVLASRSRALLIFINLYAFEPWGKQRWNRRLHQELLSELIDNLPYLRKEDSASVKSEFDLVLRRLRLQSVPWLKVTLVALGGVGLGVLTAGLAAPVVGGAIGASMGLSGAAATSAGLAALGGGSIAAGGFGMAGGTIVLAGLGGIGGAGFAAGTGRATGFTWGQVAADAVLLAVIARLVLIDVESDDGAARKVAESLHQRVTDLETVASTMITRINDLKRRLKTAEAESAKDKATIERLKAELKAVKEENRELEVTRQAIESVAAGLDTAA